MSGRPQAMPAVLTKKRRRKLEQIVRAGTSPQRLVLRARIALAAGEGTANAQISRELGCSEATVRTWRGRFARLGIPGLLDKRRPGREETHGPSDRLAVVAIATSVPPCGMAISLSPCTTPHACQYWQACGVELKHCLRNPSCVATMTAPS